MPYNIQTGQLDLEGLKEYFLRQAPTSLFGSALNTTGFYPYTGNPSDFAHSGYVTGISGDISGYIDTVSGVIRTDLVESGTNLSGYTTNVKGQLKSDITQLSGDKDQISGDLRLLSGVVYVNQSNIGGLETSLVVSGQNLEELIIGTSGDISGYVDGVSGVLNTKVSNLDVSLRGHVYSDYLSKKDVGAGNLGISGQTTFHKNPHFNKGIYLDKVSNHSNFATIQTGVGLYSIVEDYGQVNGQNYQTMTNYMRFPSPELGTTYNVIVGSAMYTGSIPL
jgi:hypothetical protein